MAQQLHDMVHSFNSNEEFIGWSHLTEETDEEKEDDQDQESALLLPWARQLSPNYVATYMKVLTTFYDVKYKGKIAEFTDQTNKQNLPNHIFVNSYLIRSCS